MEEKVFVNRILNMRNIKYIGLDMDHTLIRYKTAQFESFVYELMIKLLVNELNYSKKCEDLKFDFNLSIRGLVLDQMNGNILKLSRYGAIRESYHGTKAIHYSSQKKFYRSTYIDLSDPNFLPVDTAFSIAVCGLFAQLVDLKDKYPAEFASYQKMARDVQYAVDSVHSQGELKQDVVKNLEKYISPDPSLVSGLKRYLAHGKKIFIITNSDYDYTNVLLNYAITPYLAPSEHWSDLFEYTITLADKPRFFYDKLRFLKINPETGYMSNLNGTLKPGIYQGGCASKFTKDLNLNGDQILYIGDHIYGDVLRLKKDCNWRTALVVEELGQEIAGQIKARPYEETIESLMAQKRPLEIDYVELSSKKVEENTSSYNQGISEVLDKIEKIDTQIAEALIRQRTFFNPKWERIFRAGAEESYFAHQVNRFACIYMEKIADLFECSPRTYFRATRRLLTHEYSK